MDVRGVSPRDRRSSIVLNERLGIEGVAEVVRCGRLQWFGLDIMVQWRRLGVTL
jgi:hypothetical protein